ncbi:MAG: Hsp33 family molecular chaperone HslO [Nannocystis sp.]|nr:Hsp33 family molecular chaperone HslO [Nannocystis sp.]
MDRLERAISSELDLRVVVAVTTALVREACERHGLVGAEALVLGRALTAACLLSTLSKSETERVRLEVRGDGPLGKVYVDSRGDGRARGFLGIAEEATPQPLPERVGRRRIGALVGAGALAITRDLGLQAPYQGVVALQSGELDEDLQHYLDHSEQMPSALGCEVLLDAQGGVLRAGGVLCQTFPGGPEEPLQRLRDGIAGGSLYDLLRQPRTTEELIGFALGGLPFEVVGATPLAFECSCDPARARAILSTLGADDLVALADEQGETAVRCSYCATSYTLAAEELRALAAELRSERS